MSNRMSYPEPIAMEHGCRVSWYTYDNEADAKAAAEAAEHNADIDERMGFDFGMVVPGQLKKLEDGTFCVVIP